MNKNPATAVEQSGKPQSPARERFLAHLHGVVDQIRADGF